MKSLISATLLAAAVGMAVPAIAADEHSHDHTAAAPQAGSQLPLVDAIVRKVDAAGGKVTLSHGPIPNLNMAGMTMTFPVKDASWLEDLKPATKVRVAIDEVNGKLTVVQLERIAK